MVDISDYKYSGPGLPDLRHADRDAEELYRFLLTPQGGGFALDHVRFLKNEDATLQNIKDALFIFLKQAIEKVESQLSYRSSVPSETVKPILLDGLGLSGDRDIRALK